MSIELCKDVQDGLSLLKSDRISDHDFAQCLAVVSSAVTKTADQTADQEEEGQQQLSNVEAKLATLSIITLFAESCRQNTGIESEAAAIQEVLTDCDVNGSRATQLVKKYREVRPLLWKRLDSLEIKEGRISSVTDLLWRQEVIVKTNNREKMTPSLRYIFSVKTDSGEDIDFETDVAGLQELATSLREACKAVDNFQNK